MRRTPLRRLALAAVFLLLGARPGWAQPAPNTTAEEAVLLKQAQAFVDAFQKGDARAVAAFWAPDGDYVDLKGRHLKGRPAIEKAFRGLFAENKGLKLRINIASVRFVTPELAIEDGTTEVMTPDGDPPSRARYTLVHVKRDGHWQLASVRDAPAVAPTNYEHLRSLEWVIGDWVDAAEKGEVARASFNWSTNQGFIVSTLTTSIKNLTVDGQTQWIGWDPIAKNLRSWSFDSSGGFGGGTWTQDGDRWIIKTSAVLRNGKRLTATNVVTRVDADTIGWQSRERTMDGNPLPDLPEVRMKRVQ